jgi:hypothetical protein
MPSYKVKDLRPDLDRKLTYYTQHNDHDWLVEWESAIGWHMYKGTEHTPLHWIVNPVMPEHPVWPNWCEIPLRPCGRCHEWTIRDDDYLCPGCRDDGE